MRLRMAALLLALTTHAYGEETIGSGHVLGNGTGVERTAKDTPLITIMSQSGSGLGAGVGTAAANAVNTVGGFVAVQGDGTIAGPAASLYSAMQYKGLGTLGGL